MDRVRAVVLIIIVGTIAAGFFVGKVEQQQFMSIALVAIGWLFGSESKPKT